MPFRNRVLISGILRTTSPLHVGTGDIVFRDGVVTKTDPPKQAEIGAVATDTNGRPYLPGTAIKGTLRSWAERCFPSDARIEKLFGSRNPELPSSVGGKVCVWDAAFDGGCANPELVPFFDSERQTGVTARVALHRGTRTAIDKKLFHLELVPAGTSFRVQIGGQDLADDEISFLLAILRGFEDRADGIQLGADTGNGWGRLSWGESHESVARITPSDVAEDMKAGGTIDIGFSGCLPVSSEILDVFHAQARKFLDDAQRPAVATVCVRIAFDGPFLVNEPADVKKRPDEKSDRPNHAPRRTPDGRALLPGQSVRGALRSRAEKIVRTFDDSAAGPVDLQPTNPACDPNLLECLFGRAGQSSAVRFSDFVADREYPIRRQEFVAIDRFTGGGANHLKFCSEFVESPQMTGTISVDLNRVQPWALGLLVLVLRDLIEGDITFGMGVSKGYGACTAEVATTRLPDNYGRLQSWLDEEGFEPHAYFDADGQLSEESTDDVSLLFLEAVSKLREELGINGETPHG